MCYGMQAKVRARGGWWTVDNSLNPPSLISLEPSHSNLRGDGAPSTRFEYSPGPPHSLTGFLCASCTPHRLRHSSHQLAPSNPPRFAPIPSTNWHTPLHALVRPPKAAILYILQSKRDRLTARSRLVTYRRTRARRKRRPDQWDNRQWPR